MIILSSYREIELCFTFASPISIWLSGIRTWSKSRYPLSAPLDAKENFGPISPIVIPTDT